MNKQTYNMNTTRDKNWVLYGMEGTLDSMPRYLGIQRQLRKAARRLRQHGHLHR